MSATQFSDITHVRNSLDRQADPEKVREMLDAHTKDVAEPWRDALLEHYDAGGGFGDTWRGLDSMHEALARYLKRNPAPAGRRKIMADELRRAGFSNVPGDVIDQSIEVARQIREMPLPYFEAKPQRAVDWGEFGGAVIPSDLSPKARAVLERRGIKTVEYPANDPKARAKAVDQLRRQLHDEGDDVLRD